MDRFACNFQLIIIFFHSYKSPEGSSGANLPGIMLIILSCLVITGGELLALGELAEDQVQEIHGDLGVEISAKT